MLENTGVMAYDGAIRYVDTGDFLQAGAQIAAVEARHAAYLNLINRDSPFPSAFDQGTKPSEIFIAAKPFIVSCPDAVARSSAACRRGCSERATRNGAASAAPLSLVGFTALHFATEPSCERPSGRECRANQSIRGGGEDNRANLTNCPLAAPRSRRSRSTQSAAAGCRLSSSARSAAARLSTPRRTPCEVATTQCFTP